MINRIKLVFLCFYLLFRPLFMGFFEARADIEKYFCLFFGSNENFEISFRYLLTFTLSTNSNGKRKGELEKYQEFQLAWYMVWMTVHNWLKGEESFSSLMSSHFLPH